MTEGLAIEIADQMMKELGIGEKYLLRYRHLQILPSQVFTEQIENEIWILLTQEVSVKILSRAGSFELSDEGINEMQHVHTGLIQITNTDDRSPVHVRFLQVIPILKKS